MQVASRQCVWKDTTATMGTILAVEATVASMTVTIAQGVLADGSKSVKVDWGDGTRDEYTSLANASHTYAAAGEYKVRISDDVKSFGYVKDGMTQASRDTLRELVSLGSKVTEITGYAFNNCRNMRGVMELPNVTKIGDYAFGSTLGITDFILPAMTKLEQTSFYAGPSPTQIHADNVREISIHFWEYYGEHLADMYLRNSTCEEIKAMANFPFYANKKNPDARFHGSDGIVLVDGTVLPT